MIRVMFSCVIILIPIPYKGAKSKEYASRIPCFLASFFEFEA